MRPLGLLVMGIALAGCRGGSEVPVSKTPDPAPTPEQRAAASQASSIAKGQAEALRNANR